jgi:hypothetical protein
MDGPRELHVHCGTHLSFAKAHVEDEEWWGKEGVLCVCAYMCAHTCAGVVGVRSGRAMAGNRGDMSPPQDPFMVIGPQIEDR